MRYLLFVPALFFGWLFVSRAILPYNEEGRYFDPDGVVVYHIQAAELFGVLAGLSLLVGTVLFVLSGGRRKPWSDEKIQDLPATDEEIQSR